MAPSVDSRLILSGIAPEKTTDVTQLLEAWRQGDETALGRLLPRIYPDLRRIAASYLRSERPNHTLQATAVVHEAYLRLVSKRRSPWQGRTHFFAAAAQLMRRILVDHARGRSTQKRGGDTPAAPPELARAAPRDLDAVIALDTALERLAELDPRKARIVELRYFGGLTVSETARVLSLSPATVHLDSRLARAWLNEQLGGEGRL